MLGRATIPVLLLAVLAALAVPAATGLLSPYMLTFIMYLLINIMLSASLNLVNGYMGEFSCGHAGFMAVGAYSASILGVGLMVGDAIFNTPLLGLSNAVWFFPLSLLGAFVFSALAGLVVAIPSFKTRGDYLAVITLAASYIVKSAIENIDSVGGPRGYMGMGKVVAAMEAAVPVPWMLIWCFTGAVASVWMLRRYLYSTLGLGVTAIHQDETAAALMGVDTNRVKLTAFMLSSGLAGVAGGLYAYVTGFVNPASFTILRSTECLVMVYLGGMGSLTGSVLSAILFTVMLEFLKPLQVAKWVVIPLVLLLLMRFRPEGIMGNRELTDLFPKLRRFLGMSS